MSDSYKWKPTPKEAASYENSSTFERGSYSQATSSFVTEKAFKISKVMEEVERGRMDMLGISHPNMSHPEALAISINDAINSWVRAVCVYSCDRVSYEGMREIASRLCIAIPEAVEDTIKMIELKRGEGK